MTSSRSKPFFDGDETRWPRTARDRVCYDDGMKDRAAFLALVLVGVFSIIACSEKNTEHRTTDVASTPRRTVVWLSEQGVDAETADLLAEAGVDQLVVRRGAVRLSGAAPVVQLLPAPTVEGSIPTAIALEIQGLGSSDHDRAAVAVWAALEADFGSRLPTELILDLPQIGDGANDFISELARESGLAVIPVLTVGQIETEAGRNLAKAAHRCIVPAFGSQDADLRGLGDMGTQPLAVRLAAFRDLGVRVRLAAALRPKCQPDVGGWAQDINALTDEAAAEIKRTSTLDRSFLTRRPVTWAGRSFGVGQTIAVAWVDAARLGLFFAECHRTILPEIEGWDLVSLPPVGPNLGLDRAELIGYLGGLGPGPTIDVEVKRSGRNLTVRLANTSVFRSAITSFGNWVQVELGSGALVASSRGGFDRVILGALERGEWRPNPSGGPNAVRFVETYLAPGEELKTGSIRLPRSSSKVRVRWQIQLSDGSSVTGVVD